MRPAVWKAWRSASPVPCFLEAGAVGLAVLTLPAGCQSGRLHCLPRHSESWRFLASAFGCACAEDDRAARREGVSGANLVTLQEPCNFIIRSGPRGLPAAASIARAGPDSGSRCRTTSSGRDPSRVRGRTCDVRPCKPAFRDPSRVRGRKQHQRRCGRRPVTPAPGRRGTGGENPEE